MNRLIIILVGIIILILFNFNIKRINHIGGAIVSQSRLKKTETDIDTITQILKNQNIILKQVLNSKTSNLNLNLKEKPEPEPKPKLSLSAGINYRDWAPLGQAEQSSTYSHYSASNALDGNLKTFSQTEMPTVNNTSYYTLKLSRPIEVNKVVLLNVLNANKKRLIPFKIIILNQNDVEVAVKRFTDVLDEYVWDNIFVVASTIKIVQEERNYLHIVELNVFGTEARDCEFYQNNVSNNSEDNFLTLKDSACKIINKTEKMKLDEQAKKFDKIVHNKAKLHKKKTQLSKKAWDVIQRQQEIEKETAATAERYGLPPPPSKFTDEQISLIKKTISQPIKKLTKAQKAQCATLYDEAMKYQKASQKLAENSANQNSNSKYYQTLAKNSADKYNEKWNEYQNKCSITGSSYKDDSTGSLAPPNA